MIQGIAEFRVAIGGTRFIMAMGAGLVNTLLFAVGILSESGYITLTLATVGAFIVSQTAQNMKTKDNTSD